MKTYDAYCESCGNKFKNTELRMRWDGRRVCKEDWETRHPQDLLRVPRVERALPWVAPDVDGPGDSDINFSTGGAYFPNPTTAADNRSCLHAPLSSTLLRPETDLSGDWSISCWVYYTGADRVNSIIRVGLTNRGYLFRIQGTGGANKAEFFVCSAGRAYGAASVETVPLNQWVNIAVQLTGGNAYFWMFDTSGTELSYSGPVVMSDNGPFSEYSSVNIGGTLVGTTLTDRFAGKIDDLRVWNADKTSVYSALPAAILASISNGLTGSETGLVLYAKFDESKWAKEAKCSKDGSYYAVPNGFTLYSEAVPPNSLSYTYFTAHTLGSAV